MDDVNWILHNFTSFNSSSGAPENIFICLVFFTRRVFVKGLMSQVGGDSLSSPASYQISSVFEVFDPSFPKAFKQKNKSQLSTFFVEWFLIASLTLAFFRKGSSCVWFIGCILIPILSWQIIPARKRVTIVIFDDPCPGRGRKKMSRFRLMVSQNLENVWSFSENLPNRWFSSPTWQDSYPPPHHPHLILTVVRREKMYRVPVADLVILAASYLVAFAAFAAAYSVVFLATLRNRSHCL